MDDFVFDIYTLDDVVFRYGFVSREEAIYELKKFFHATGKKDELKPYRFLKDSQGRASFPSLRHEYIEEFEKYRASIAQENQVNEPSPKHPTLYMTKGHPAYSSELEAAVSCWLALFADASPGKVATHTKPKALSWLAKNRPKLDESQHKRIATVLTPDSRKAGGAPPTPE